jgi:membrane protein DedA with SNARE-associated domain
MDTLIMTLGRLPDHGALRYLAVFAVAMIDATGLPLPGRVLLVAAGAALAQDWSQAMALTAAAALGALVGDHVWYAAGRMGGDRLMGAYCTLSLVSRRCERRARENVERFGPWAIVVGRFFAGVRIASAPLLATGGISYPRYLVFEVIGAVVWSATFVLLGYGLGERWRTIMDRYGLGTAMAALGGLMVLGLVAIVAVRLLRRLRHGRAEAERRRAARRPRRPRVRTAA